VYARKVAVDEGGSANPGSERRSVKGEVNSAIASCQADQKLLQSLKKQVWLGAFTGVLDTTIFVFTLPTLLTAFILGDNNCFTQM
jgi:hypothetical protein